MAHGREAGAEFDESLAPAVSDEKTLGCTLPFQYRDLGEPVKYAPPPFARDFSSADSFPLRFHNVTSNHFWWVEWGGELDCIHQCQEIKDELTRAVYGLWDHIKNHGEHGAENFALRRIGSVLGKCESRRVEGDYMLTQNDLVARRTFDDDYRLWARCAGKWRLLAEISGNYQRRRNHPGEGLVADAVRLEVTATNGGPSARVTQDAGASFVCRFDGSVFGFAGLKGPDPGQFSVSVDGGASVTATMLDACCLTGHYRIKPWFYPASLAPGRHEAQVTFLGAVPDKARVLHLPRPEDAAAGEYAANRLYIDDVPTLGPVTSSTK